MGRYFTPLVPDGLRSAGSDEFVMPQPNGEIGQNLQVAARLTGRVQKLGGELVAPFALTGDAFLLYPQSRGEYHLRVALRLAILDNIGNHSETFSHRGVVASGGGKRSARICAHDECRLNSPVLHGAEQIDGIKAGFVRNGSRRNIPDLFHLQAVLRIGDQPTVGKSVRQSAGVADASARVRLTG